jgi:hypothetical protein
LFAITPSTKLFVSPIEIRNYTAPNGTVQGLVDYRIKVPPDQSSTSRRVRWSLESHEISEARIELAGETIGSRDDPSHVTSVSYEGGSATRQPLSLEAEISVEMRKVVRTRYSEEDGGYYWETDISHPTRSMTVTASRMVTTYDPTVTVQPATYPDKTTGLALQADHPLSGATIGTGSLEYRWEFYAARDPSWDTIVSTREGRTSRSPSPVHPVGVVGYPGRFSPTVAGGTLTDRETTAAYESPAEAIPETVDVGVTESRYNTTSRVAVRLDNGTNTTVDPTPVVAGVEANVTRFATKQITETNLTIRPLESNLSTARIEVILTANETGEPIHLRDREGSIEIEGKHIETNASGTATVLVDNRGPIVASYQPPPWSETDEAYTSSSDRVLVRTGIFTSSGFGGLISSLLWIFATPLVVLWALDKIPSADTWPPWRLLS